MTRTRAQRRHNTRVHGQRRLTEANARCSASVTLSGERCSCSVCESEKRMRLRYEQPAPRCNTLDGRTLTDILDAA
jgi:hypothetical protein